MERIWRAILWQQFGAAIDMLENAMLACPDELWSASSRRPEFWYSPITRSSGSTFTSPARLRDLLHRRHSRLDEMDPAALIPEHPYTKELLHTYLEHGREKCRATIADMSDEKAVRRCGFEWVDVTNAELLLYNMRHVQHHAAQLNLILRQTIDLAPGWVARAKHKL